MTDDPDMPGVGETLDDFLLVEELGEGSFATVYLARQRSMSRTVALKVSEDVGEEGQMLAQLDHPHIVRVYDQRPLPERGLRLLYMEYVSAGTLDAVIDRVQETPPDQRRGQLLLDVIDAALEERGQRPPLDSLLRRRFAEATWPEAVALLGSQLADALDHAHGHDVLHRDVKAANVLLAPNGRAKLADFNVSFREGGEADAEEFMGGSPAYMAPEQIEACDPRFEREPDSLDGRIDQFALGVLLWELLSGELPYFNPPIAGDLSMFFGALLEVRRENVPSKKSQSMMPPDTPGMLLGTLERSFAFEPDERHASPRAFGYDLRVCMRPDARALMNPDQASWVRWAQRHPMASVLLGAIIPNTILSGLNVAYNKGALVDDATWQAFQAQVALVNVVAFSIGLSFVRWALPLIRAVRERNEPAVVEPDRAARAIDVGLGVGHRMTPVVFALWIFGGLTFPVWWQLQSGVANGEAYFHFGVSNLFFGVLAANLTFFLISWIVLRIHVPRLLGPDVPPDPVRGALDKLSERASKHFTVSMCVPFVLIIVLAFVPDASRGSFLALGLMGIASFGATFALYQSLRRLSAALRDI